MDNYPPRNHGRPSGGWTVAHPPALRTIRLLQERVPPGAGYPFTVPAVAALRTLELTRRVCFFVGENGSGKSTLLEAIAENYGLGREGGPTRIRHETTSANATTASLWLALRLAASS